jgi:hypothetical protein
MTKANYIEFQTNLAIPRIVDIFKNSVKKGHPSRLPSHSYCFSRW